MVTENMVKVVKSMEPNAAVKTTFVTPQMLIDTACWCQDEQELRDTLLMAAEALSALAKDDS